MKIVLLGYTSPYNTCFYPWERFYKVFKHLGYDCVWIEETNIKDLDSTPRIYICWNVPDAKELVDHGYYRSGDIILQKLTSLSKHDPHVNWTSDPMTFFKNWKWTLYKMTEDLYDQGINIYNFGCKTDINSFPEKKRICNKLNDRQFWIPWGSCLYDWSEIQASKPVIDNFKYDLGYVGSKWGVVGRGNIDSLQIYMAPLAKRYPNSKFLGRGFASGPVLDSQHKEALVGARLCPIVNAPSWQAERAIQDRFWSVFTAGRFGVVDSEGVYDFFDKDEVVCEINPEEYVAKSIYYLENIDKQVPFIKAAQKRIKKEYNYYNTWKNIISALA